jgi:hypothetical protein
MYENIKMKPTQTEKGGGVGKSTEKEFFRWGQFDHST